jgi:hypothetical protein
LLLPDQCADPATQLQDGGIFGNCGMSLVDGSSFASACNNYSFHSGATHDGCNDSCTSQDEANSNKKFSFYSGTMDDGSNDSCTSGRQKTWAHQNDIVWTLFDLSSTTFIHF